MVRRNYDTGNLHNKRCKDIYLQWLQGDKDRGDSGDGTQLWCMDNQFTGNGICTGAAGAQLCSMRYEGDPHRGRRPDTDDSGKCAEASAEGKAEDDGLQGKRTRSRRFRCIVYIKQYEGIYRIEERCADGRQEAGQGNAYDHACERT